MIMRASDATQKEHISLFKPDVRSRYPQKRAREVSGQSHYLFLNKHFPWRSDVLSTIISSAPALASLSLHR